MSNFVQSTQFLVLGDWGTSDCWSFNANRSEKVNGSPKDAVAAQMAKVYQAHEDKPIANEFCVISVGDNFYPSGVVSTTDKQWKIGFTDAYAGVKCDWFSVLGNHDWENNPKAQIDFKADPRWHMDSYYFTKIINNVEFIFIDTPTLCPCHTRGILGSWNKNCVLITDEARDTQMAWLEATLKASKSDWIVVVGHYPIFSGGTYRDLTEMDRVNILLKKYCVDAYLCGHDHSLQHIFNSDTTQFHHFLCGTGSATGRWGYIVRELPLKTQYCANICGFLNVVISGDVMKVEFISDTGVVLHDVSINQQDRTQKMVVDATDKEDTDSSRSNYCEV